MTDAPGPGLPTPDEIEALRKLDVELPWVSDEFKAQIRHNRRVETAKIALAFMGPVFGFVVVLSFLAASTWLIDGGHAVAGTVLGSVDLVALATVFVLGEASPLAGREEEKSRTQQQSADEAASGS